MKLSENFSLGEFLESGGVIIEPTDEQVFCLKILCENILQPIRSFFGPTTVTSGLRNGKSTEALIAAGYPASRTSDHLAWCSANPKGTGAADIVCSNRNMAEVFDWVQRELMYQIGQVIHYPEKGIIHVSNRFNRIFHMPDTRKELTRIMVYKNGKFISVSKVI